MKKETNQTNIQSYLNSDERILWEGHASVRPLITAYDIPVSIGGLIILLLVIYEFPSIFHTYELPTALFLLCVIGIPFFFASLYIFFGRFVFVAIRRKALRYVITNKRFLRFHGRRINTFPMEKLASFTCTVHSNGLGTIELSYVTSPFEINRKCGTGLRFGFLTLENIPQPNKVEQIISDLDAANK